MKHMIAAFAFALAACATTDQSADDGAVEQTFDDGATASVRVTETGIEATLETPEAGRCAELSWTAGAETFVVRLDDRKTVYRIGSIGVSTETAGKLVHGIWNLRHESERQHWCGPIDLLIAVTACDALVDPGRETQCVRDVLNDIC